jgi:hypothetical protein
MSQAEYMLLVVGTKKMYKPRQPVVIQGKGKTENVV